MARPLRLEVAGGTYHITARGNERKPIYRDDTDRRTFLGTLGQVIARFDWRCLGYCLMGNHYHLLAETPQPNLARGMRHLNGVYAQRFNRRHRRSGHLMQGRYGAVLIERGEHLFSAVRYVVRNPVRAGLCTRPQDWPWSSYRGMVGLEPPGLLAVDLVLELFGETHTIAREQLRAFVEDASELGESPPSGAVAGSDAFVHTVATGLRVSPEVPRRDWQMLRPSLGGLLLTHSRDEAIALAYRHYGYRMHEIADALGCHYATVSRRLRAFERLMLDCKT